MITVSEIRERFDRPERNMQPRAACGTHRGRGGCCQKNAYSVGGAFLICINARPKMKDEQYLRFPYISALAVGLAECNPALASPRKFAEMIIELNDSSCFNRAWLALDVALRLKASAKGFGVRRGELSAPEVLLRVGVVSDYDKNYKTVHRAHKPVSLADRIAPPVGRHVRYTRGPRYFGDGQFTDCNDWMFSEEEVRSMLGPHLATDAELATPAKAAPCCPNCGWSLGKEATVPTAPATVAVIAVEEPVLVTATWSREPDPEWLL